jgi:hypothetical protein
MEHASLRPFILAKDIKAWLRNYLYYSTLIYVFSLLIIVRLGLSIRFIEVSLLLICLVVNVTRVSAWIYWFLLYLGMSGIIGIARGTDSLPQFLIEFRAISINLLFYSFFFKLIRNDFERAFFTYTRIAFWFAVIAFPLWVGSCITAHDYIRLQGLATEPAEFCSIILPAYYWYAYQLFTERKRGVEVAVFTLAVTLSGSSLGYLSVAFGILLLLSRGSKHILTGFLTVCVLLGTAYEASSFFRMRVDDTLLAATTLDFSGIGSNLSAYSLVSNALVTEQVLKESPLIGNGLGSHAISHARFLGNLRGIEFFVDMNLENANALEAGSFTLRVLSEFGILGYLGLLAFLVYFHVGGKGPRAAMSNAILVCFFLKLIRSGQYYPPEQFFFVFIYILNHRKFRRESRAGVHGASSRSPLAPLDPIETKGILGVNNEKRTKGRLCLSI